MATAICTVDAVRGLPAALLSCMLAAAWTASSPPTMSANGTKKVSIVYAPLCLVLVNVCEQLFASLFK